ncbi:MAG TPA: hypothetical protein VLK56_07865 [Solirubrobacterales bacterium]|nr:hypothetical protein [Solirubrobacterales bacterium]
MIDREIRWANRLSVAAAVICGLISWSLSLGLLAAVAVRIGIEGMTLIWEEVELLRGNDPYADRRAESELIREERLRRERQEEEGRQLTLRDRCRQLIGLVRRRGKQEDDRDEQGPSDEP